MGRMRLTQRFAFLLPLRLAQRRLFRSLRMLGDGKRYAKTRVSHCLAYTVITHQSLLLRRLGDVDMRLQHNKVVNLRLAAARLDGVCIRPGEVFSLWLLVGRPSRRKGYLPGLCLRNGQVSSDTGGGLCQLGNLLYWMFLHTPLTVIERHHHQFDPFPDHERRVPFGTGASLMYNFLDLQVKNDTPHTWQVRLWLDKQYLFGRLCTDQAQGNTCRVYEADHRFVRKADGIYRQNRILRDWISGNEGAVIRTEVLMVNDSLVQYAVDPSQVSGMQQA